MGVAVYTRISDDDGTGLGVARQEADCRQLAAAKGWTVARVFTDNDVGAWSSKPRPAYTAMLEALRTKEVDGVVFWHIDRLTRRMRDLEDFLDACVKAGATNVAACSGDFDLATHDGQFMARLLVAVARKESDDKSRRTKRKHLELAQAGKPCGGTRPFGYKTGGLEIEPGEADLLRDAAARVLAGDSLRRIAMEWNDAGIIAPRGGRITQTSLRRMVTNPRIIGVRTLAGVEIAPAQWPSIIDEQTFRRVGRVLAERRANAGSVGFGARTYLLTGFLYCGRCGTRMMAQARKVRERRRPTYICPAGPKGGCGGIRVSAEPLEASIVGDALSVLPVMRARVIVANDITEDREAELIARLADDEKMLDRIAGDYAARILTRRQYLAANTRLADNTGKAQRELAQLRGSTVLEGAAELDRVSFDELTLDRRRAILSELIDRITINPAERGTTVFDPARASIIWRV